MSSTCFLGFTSKDDEPFPSQCELPDPVPSKSQGDEENPSPAARMSKLFFVKIHFGMQWIHDGKGDGKLQWQW